MPTFHYTAKRGPREVVEGLIEAENRSGALAHLAELGYIPVRVSEEAAAASVPMARRPSSPVIRRGRVSHTQLAALTRQFASLTRSHVPLLRTLYILEEQCRQPTLRAILHDISEEVRQGETLSSALAKFPSVFSPLYVNLVHSGEVSGALDAVLERLAEQAEQEEEMRAKVRAALTYPIFVGVVGCFTVIFLMTFVMPRFSRLLSGLTDRLPLPTRILLTVVEWMSSGWFWGAVVGAVIVMAIIWRGLGAQGQRLRDRLLLRLPLAGSLILQLEIARFARAFGLLITHGVPILRAIEVAIPVVNHRLIRFQLERLPEGLRQGNSLSDCLKPLAIGTPFLVNTIAVGEESGAVGDALTEVATYYERDATRMLQTMATLLEPLFIVVVGLFVGFIVLSVLLPVFELSSLVR
jgi:type II secretory pathway component PulF